MSSPFSIFRRYEKVMMVAITGVAIVSFVLLGAVQQVSTIPPSIMVLVFACLLAVVGALIGMSRGKAGEWSISGALIGVIIGFFGLMFSGERVAVGMDKGSLTEKQLVDLQRQRSIANGFMHLAIQHSFGDRLPPAIHQQFLFDFTQGAQGEVREIVFGEILRREADEIGLSIPKDAVVDFIKNRFSQEGLDAAVQNVLPSLSQQDRFMLQFSLMNVKPKPISVEAFAKIRSQLRVSETELIAAIGSELKAVRAFALLQANNELTPEMFWEYFQKLNVKADVDLAIIPVADFESFDATPTELDLQELFNKYNKNTPGFTIDGQPAPGTPGFLQPRRVQVSYVEIAPEHVSALLDEVTDEEVEARYEERYGKAMPDSDGPDLPLLDENASSTPADTETPATIPAEQTPPATDDSTSSFIDLPSSSPVALLQDDAAAPVVGDIPPPSTDSEIIPGDIPAPPSEDTPEPAVGLPPVPSNVIPDAPSSDVPVLNDELREELREAIRGERSRAAIRAKSEEAFEHINGILSRIRISVINEEFKNTPDFVPDATGISIEEGVQEIQAYVTANSMRFVTTPLISYQNLRSSEDYGVGTSFNRTAIGNSAQIPAADNLFLSSPTATFIPSTSIQFVTGTEFIYWKLEDKAPYAPNRIDEEPDLHEQVVNAWRQLQAAPKAEARANEIAKLVQDSTEPTPEVLADQTVSGKEGDLFINVRQLNDFSWMTRPLAPQTNLSQETPVSPSLVEGVENPGELFYKTVFNELKVGETKVIPNADHTEYLVVKLAYKNPATPEAADALRQKFIEQGYQPAYTSMAQADLASVRVNFFQELYQSYGVDIRSESERLINAAND